MRQSGQAVDGDDGAAPPVFGAGARQWRISAQIIFFQRKVGGGLGKGARACGKSCHFECLEKKTGCKKVRGVVLWGYNLK